jgi:hypothetical protein
MPEADKPRSGEFGENINTLSRYTYPAGLISLTKYILPKCQAKHISLVHIAHKQRGSINPLSTGMLDIYPPVL